MVLSRQMKAGSSEFAVAVGLSLLFCGLGAAFLFDLWGRPDTLVPVPPVAPDFTNTTTVRQSAAELFRTGGDTSGMSCYACHDARKQVIVHLDTNNNVILPKEHNDLVMRHGRNNRNDYCFNCHDSQNLEQLRPHAGPAMKLTEGSRLCGSCHGPTYRDWEAGIHGRVSGYWDRQRGAITRQDCTSCHDPHNPAFPSMKPGPGPQPRRSEEAKGH